MWRKPGHVLVQPDQQGSALAQRRRVTGPIRRAVAGGGWLAHATRLTAWIRDVNPWETGFCNNALRIRENDGSPDALQ